MMPWKKVLQGALCAALILPLPGCVGEITWETLENGGCDEIAADGFGDEQPTLVEPRDRTDGRAVTQDAETEERPGEAATAPDDQTVITEAPEAQPGTQGAAGGNGLGALTSGCGAEPTRGDVLAIFASAGDVIEIDVDTIREQTTADLAVLLFEDENYSFRNVLALGDDEVECTASPGPSPLCPSLAHTVEGSGDTTLFFAVVALGDCADPERVEYVLHVSRNGDRQDPIFVEDEALIGS